MHYYQFNIKSYHAATSHLSPAEDLAYRRLIDHYMDTEQPIPDDFAKVARRLRLNADAVQTILIEFFTSSLDGWQNEKCNAQIAAYQAQSYRNAINGKKGGRPKKNQTGYDADKPTGKRPVSQKKGGVIKSDHSVIDASKADAIDAEIIVKNAGFEQVKKPVDATGSKEKTHSQPTGNPNERQLVTNNNKQITNNKNNKPAAKASGRISATGVDGLMAIGVSEQVAFDYLAVRKAKRSPLTQTALDQMQREADKAGITIAEAITIATGNGWVGFKVEWINKPMTQEAKSFIEQHTDASWREGV